MSICITPETIKNVAVVPKNSKIIILEPVSCATLYDEFTAVASHEPEPPVHLTVDTRLYLPFMAQARVTAAASIDSLNKRVERLIAGQDPKIVQLIFGYLENGVRPDLPNRTEALVKHCEGLFLDLCNIYREIQRLSQPLVLQSVIKRVVIDSANKQDFQVKVEFVSHMGEILTLSTYPTLPVGVGRAWYEQHPRFLPR